MATDIKVYQWFLSKSKRRVFVLASISYGQSEGKLDRTLAELLELGKEESVTMPYKQFEDLVNKEELSRIKP
jgi:hypothetical protein